MKPLLENVVKHDQDVEKLLQLQNETRDKLVGELRTKIDEFKDKHGFSWKSFRPVLRALIKEVFDRERPSIKELFYPPWRLFLEKLRSALLLLPYASSIDEAKKNITIPSQADIVVRQRHALFKV